MAIESIIQKLGSEALGKVAAKSDEVSKPASGGTNFKEMLNQMESGTDFANLIGIDGNADSSPAAGMQAMGGENIAYTPMEQTTSLSSPDASGKVLDMLGEVNKGQMQMDSLVNHVMYSGKKFSNQELLVIQAHVFHFAQMTELTVKVAEQGVSSVKTVLNTQVQ